MATKKLPVKEVPVKAATVKRATAKTTIVGTTKLAAARHDVLLTDVMLDLETYGTRPGCGIISIGAVAFNHLTGDLGPEFYTVISRKDSMKFGLHELPSTMEWWSKQSPEARAVLDEAKSSKVTVRGACDAFRAFMNEVGTANNLKQPHVWGLGADFDGPILAHLYHEMGEPLPWRKNRCLRMLRDLLPDVAKVPRVGTFHNALDDARTQVQEALALISVHRVAQAALADRDATTSRARRTR